MSDRSAHRPFGAGRRYDRRNRGSARSAVSSEIAARLAAIETAMAAMAEAQAATGTALGGAVDRLEKQFSRAGREQFKANALAETQQRSVDATLEQLRDAATQREREIEQLRERLTHAGVEGRLDVIRRLLPALDGLEEALASGRRLQRRMTAPTDTQSSLWQRLALARRAAPETDPSARQALTGWLEGLTFVQERLLAALAADNVVPIITEGRAFDPHRHIAVDVVPATGQAEPGDIVREHRRGFVRGDTVLRYAEVVVARAPVETLK